MADPAQDDPAENPVPALNDNDTQENNADDDASEEETYTDAVNDNDTQENDADAGASQGDSHTGAVTDEIVPPSDPSRAQGGSQPGDEPGDGPDSSSSNDDSNDSDDDGDSDCDSQPDVEFREPCKKICEPHFANRREAAFRRKREIRRLRAHLESALMRGRNLRRRLLEAKLQLRERRRSGRTRPTKAAATWPEVLARKLLGGSREPHEKIYKLACNEENSSYKYLYPGLQLREASEGEMEEYRARPRWMASNSARTAPTHSNGLPSGRNICSDLGSKVIGIILRHLLVFEGRPVHCVSRLDPHCDMGFGVALQAGIAALDELGTGLTLLHRFHIGNGSFSLTHEMPPHVLLAPLAGRFAEGIGNRLQRIQRIGLFWIGNQDVCHIKSERGKYTSRRTQALSFFPQAIRAKHIELYFRESDPWYMRRKHEPRGMINYHKEHTINQPDMRLLRDMNTVQGITNIRCLRGVFSVRLYDYDQYDKKGQKKVCIRNHNFVRYVNEETTSAKPPQKERLAEFENLGPLVASQPSLADFEYVKNAITLVKEETGYRQEGEPGHETADDSDGLTPGFNGNNGADDDDDDSDDDGHYRSGAHQRSRSSNGLTPGFNGNNGADEDDDTRNDTGEYPRAAKRRRGYTNGAASTQVRVIEVEDDDDAIMDDAPLEEDQGDDEMSDGEQNGDVDSDTVMSDASQGEDDSDGDESGNHGVLLRSSPHTAAARGRRSGTSSMFSWENDSDDEPMGGDGPADAESDDNESDDDDDDDDEKDEKKDQE
ncbi:hypothetical protein LLEC1_01782 [Akanthomyces lecanii]|uniref:Uncharacterized protein n=1 Tax=Cordyceps confragosa TaxID=2714763 RepID=A0A179I223_CORDF|nr:hypothetical protein LLEC1_01782 [Akanthomyces lecanii]